MLAANLLNQYVLLERRCQTAGEAGADGGRARRTVSGAGPPTLCLAGAAAPASDSRPGDAPGFSVDTLARAGRGGYRSGRLQRMARLAGGFEGGRVVVEPGAVKCPLPVWVREARNTVGAQAAGPPSPPRRCESQSPAQSAGHRAATRDTPDRPP